MNKLALHMYARIYRKLLETMSEEEADKQLIDMLVATHGTPDEYASHFYEGATPPWARETLSRIKAITTGAMTREEQEKWR